jgi:hypothetical protein
MARSSQTGNSRGETSNRQEDEMNPVNGPADAAPVHAALIDDIITSSAMFSTTMMGTAQNASSKARDTMKEEMNE